MSFVPPELRGATASTSDPFVPPELRDIDNTNAFAAPPVEDSFGDNALDFANQVGSSVTRGLTGVVDIPGDLSHWLAKQAYGEDVERLIPSLTDAMTEHTPLGQEHMDQGWGREAAEATGTAISFAGGLVPRVSSAVNSAVDAGLDILGFGTKAAPVGPTNKNVQDYLSIARGETNNDLAPYKINAEEVLKTGASPRVIKDPKYSEANKQGLHDGLVQFVKQADPRTRSLFEEMINITQVGRKDWANNTRHLDVPGREVGNRLKVVQQANRLAGEALDGVANSLKGQRVDFQAPVSEFLGGLKNMGILFDPNTRQVSFSGSDIEGLPGPENLFRRVLDRFSRGGDIDAHDLHRIKTYIDANLSYGKSLEGLDAKSERLLGQLRKGIDGVLDANFPEYDQVNTAYSDTIKALGAFRDAGGKRIDLSSDNLDSALGVLSRRLESNAASRHWIDNAFDLLDETARKYQAPGRIPQGQGPLRITNADMTPYEFNGNVNQMVRLASELDGMFPSPAGYSHHGEIEKAMNKGIDHAANPSFWGPMVDGAKWAGKKARGINEDNLMQALMELVKE